MSECRGMRSGPGKLDRQRVHVALLEALDLPPEDLLHAREPQEAHLRREPWALSRAASKAHGVRDDRFLRSPTGHA